MQCDARMSFVQCDASSRVMHGRQSNMSCVSYEMHGSAKGLNCLWHSKIKFFC